MKNSIQKVLNLSSLHEISKSLLSEYDLHKLLNTIAENALYVLNADIVTLYEYDRVKNDVNIPPVIKGILKAEEVLREKGKAVPHKSSITFKMIKRKKPFYADNAKVDWVSEGIISTASLKKGESFFDREAIVSSAGIPLCVDAEVVGVLFVNYRNSIRFTPEHKELIETFANYAALAIRNARMLERKEIYVKQLSVLNEIGKKISQVTMDIPGILYLVYKQTKKLMDVTNFYIALYDEPSDTVHFKLALEDNRRMKPEGDYASRKGGDGLTEYIIRHKKPLLLPSNPRRWYRFQNKEPIGKFAHSWLGVPIIISKTKRVRGVIAVQDFKRKNVYTKDHRNILMTIASQAAIAIDKACLRALDALYDTSREIAGKPQDTESILQAIVKRAVELSDSNGGSIFLCDHTRKTVKIVVHHGLKPTLLGHEMKFGVGVAGRVAETGIPMIKNEYHEWNERDPYFNDRTNKRLFKSVVEVPLMSEGKVIGVLAMSSSKKNRKYTSDDVLLLERFAGPAAIVINDAKTHNYLQTLIESTPDAIIAVDKNGAVTEFNKASKDILGYSMDEVGKGDVTMLYAGGLNEAVRINSLLKSSEDGKIKDVETFVKSKKGEIIPIRFAGSLLYDWNNQKIGSVGHMEDLREFKSLEKRYHALYEVGKVSVEIPESNLGEICQRLVEVLTREVLYLIACYLYLWDDDGELKLMAKDGDIDEKKIKPGTKQKTMVFNHPLGQSNGGIQLIANGRTLGWIVASKGNGARFLKEETKFLNQFARLSALVIAKAKDVNRSKETARALEKITYDIVDLSGAGTYTKILDKIKEIVRRWVPGINWCLYHRHTYKDRLAIRLECTSEGLGNRLKTYWNKNRAKTPFLKGKKPKTEIILFPAWAPKTVGGEEGSLIVEKATSENSPSGQLNEIEKLILPMVSSAVGIALYNIRRDIATSIPPKNGGGLI